MKKYEEISVGERFHKHGYTWLALFLILFLSHPSKNIWYNFFDALFVVSQFIVLVIFVEKVLIKYVLRNQRTILFFLLLTLANILMTLVTVSIEFYFMDLFKQTRYFIGNGTEKIFPYLVRFMWFIVVSGISTITYYQKKEKQDHDAQVKLENDKLDMELRYLKSQINPHFLFNALNNIYSMVYTKDENASDSVLKLSEMLRYVLVECQAEAIPLEKEIKYIDNYIDFQMMRMEANPDVRLLKTIEDNSFLVAPMIFQPIIENCFKYSRIENDPQGFVHITISQKDKSLTFVAQNSIKASAKAVVENTQKVGIGLENVKKRLELHYGKDYRFDVVQTDETYMVTIHIGRINKIGGKND